MDRKNQLARMERNLEDFRVEVFQRRNRALVGVTDTNVRPILALGAVAISTLVELADSRPGRHLRGPFAPVVQFAEQVTLPPERPDGPIAQFGVVGEIPGLAVGGEAADDFARSRTLNDVGREHRTVLVDDALKHTRSRREVTRCRGSVERDQATTSGDPNRSTKSTSIGSRSPEAYRCDRCPSRVPRSREFLDWPWVGSTPVPCAATTGRSNAGAATGSTSGPRAPEARSRRSTPAGSTRVPSGPTGRSHAGGRTTRGTPFLRPARSPTSPPALPPAGSGPTPPSPAGAAARCRRSARSSRLMPSRARRAASGRTAPSHAGEARPSRRPTTPTATACRTPRTTAWWTRTRARRTLTATGRVTPAMPTSTATASPTLRTPSRATAPSRRTPTATGSETTQTPSRQPGRVPGLRRRRCRRQRRRLPHQRCGDQGLRR
ncbi:MAG: hypothetical protein JWN65_1216 [Solirubrobacterales bacterium]|nr:hypothetical protein [Solirubrobacterales bacterium]